MTRNYVYRRPFDYAVQSRRRQPVVLTGLPSVPGKFSSNNRVYGNVFDYYPKYSVFDGAHDFEGPATSGITVTHTDVTSGATSSSQQTTFTSVASGAELRVAISQSGSGLKTYTVSDTVNGAWTELVDANYANSDRCVTIFGITSAAGSPVITVTPSGATNFMVGYLAATGMQSALEDSSEYDNLDSDPMYSSAPASAASGAVIGSSVDPWNDPEDGKVGHWLPAFQTPALVDASGRGNTATNNGSTIVSSSRGPVRDFDGVNDYLRIKDTFGIFGGTTSFAFTSWIYADSTATTRHILDLRGENNIICGFFGNLGAGVLDLRAQVGGSWASRGSSAFAVGAWHHVAWVYSASSGWTMYIDGDDTGNGSGTTGAIGTNTWNSAIGSFSSSLGTQTFDGQISDVRIYNRILTAAEIRDLYERTRKPFTPRKQFISIPARNYSPTGKSLTLGVIAANASIESTPFVDPDYEILGSFPATNPFGAVAYRIADNAALTDERMYWQGENVIRQGPAVSATWAELVAGGFIDNTHNIFRHMMGTINA